MDQSHKTFAQRPDAAAAEAAEQTLGRIAYGMFGVLIDILDNPQCNRKLPCFRVNALADDETDPNRRFRETFLVCWRWMTTQERRTTRMYFLWQLYCHEESVDATHEHQLIQYGDPNDCQAANNPFKVWCKKRSDKRASLFLEVIGLGGLCQEIFESIWGGLSETTRGSLLHFWNRVATCGCHRVTPTTHRNEPALEIQLTESSSIQIITAPS